MFQKAEKEKESALKEVTELSEGLDIDITKSDLSELFNNLIENYRFFLSTLSSEQIVIVFNIIGYIALMSSLTTLVSLLIGDQIIKSLNLETKYPKLAKYIQLKQTVNKYSLRFYIVLFYIELLILISVNIFMFFF